MLRPLALAMSLALFACSPGDERGRSPAPPAPAEQLETEGAPASTAGAAAHAGLTLPAQHNETDWDDERLRNVWTYDAVQHAAVRFADAEKSGGLGRADVASADAFEAWQSEARALLRAALRLDAASWPGLLLDVRELEREPGEGYTLHTIDYLVEPGMRVTASLLVPEASADAPGVVLWHGHGPTGRAALVDAAGADTYMHRGAVGLAQAGYVVLAPDVRSMRAEDPEGHHTQLVHQLALFGRPALGVFTADALRAIDVLAARPEVDAERIGVAGTSLGGQLAMLSAALDPRVKAAVVAGALGDTNTSLVNGPQCPCQYVPLLATALDIGDIAAAAAPTPIQFLHGTADPVFPFEAAERAFGRARHGWSALGAPNAVTLQPHDGAHEWDGEYALAWLDAWLGRAE